MSLVALSIDAMLPALGQIRDSLKIATANDTQQIISYVFLGMAPGLLIYGPLSDSIGRKKPLYFGIIIFILGSALSALATDLNMMLTGRFLQGLGAASSRVVSLAMIRDCFRGREMAKVMSLIMVIFVLVPVLAPILGQGVLLISDWRTIFYSFIFLASLAAILLKIRQEETLAKKMRIEFSITNVGQGAWETAKDPIARPFTVAAGIIFGAFIGYLNTSQQVLQIQYNLGETFPFYFAGLALCLGVSSFLNSRLVEKFGMTRLSILSLIAIIMLSSLYLISLLFYEDVTPLFALMLYLSTCFLFFGFLFGNLNAIAIDGLGHIAGIANSVIGCTQTLISVLIGASIGNMYDGNLYPMTIGFLVSGFVSLAIVLYAQRKNPEIEKL